jgi:type I pantothenate kinase
VRTVAALAEEVRERRARTIAVTGGVAAGKSTFAAGLAGALGGLGVPGVPVVATDGFLLPNDELDRRGLTARKGFPESFDAAALRQFLQAFRAAGRAEAPVYSHLAYDVVPGARQVVSGEIVIVEGLHLAHPALGVRELLDMVIHLDADDADLERWFLDRFRSLRAEAAREPAAFLHPFRDMPAEVIEGMALDVWRSVNLVVLREEVRPQVGDADVLIRFGPAHDIESIEARE